MLKIRLTRTGKKHEPHYRIVVVEARSKRDGKYIEQIGYYNPRSKDPIIKYDKALLEKWIKNGAQMTDTIYDAFVREGIFKQSKRRKGRIADKIEHSKKTKTEKKKVKAEEKAAPEKKKEEQPKEPEADKQQESSDKKGDKPKAEDKTEPIQKEQDTKAEAAPKKETPKEEAKK